MTSPQKTGSIVWTDPKPLSEYRTCPKGQGIYAIGRARDKAMPVAPTPEFDAYMFNWPDNLEPLYVGISENNGEGIRRRVRSHFKGKGNKRVFDLVRNGEELWFVACSGEDVVNYEALFLIAFTPGTGFIANKRSETRNHAKRLNRKIDAEMRAKGLDPNYQPWLNDPDYFLDG
jgi:hypothetical protein